MSCVRSSAGHRECRWPGLGGFVDAERWPIAAELGNGLVEVAAVGDRAVRLLASPAHSRGFALNETSPEADLAQYRGACLMGLIPTTCVDKAARNYYKVHRSPPHHRHNSVARTKSRGLTGLGSQAAEIKVVMVENKAWVKAHACALKSLASRCKKHTVMSLNRHGCWAKHPRLSRLERSVADGSAEVGIDPLVAVGDQPPGRLSALMALVAPHHYDI